VGVYLIGNRSHRNKQFFDAPPCCIDSWFGEPLRAKLSSADDLSTPDMKLLLHRIANQFAKTTNMMLEGLLSEIKSSVPSGKRSPNAEKVSFLAHLHQTLKQHVARGRHDSRGPEPRDKLIKEGVPLEHSSCSTWARPDVRWRNSLLAKWKHQHPDAMDEELSAEVTRVSQVWREYSHDQRVAAISVLDADVAGDDCGMRLGQDIVHGQPRSAALFVECSCVICV
jgi:hypothetical protein